MQTSVLLAALLVCSSSLVVKSLQLEKRNKLSLGRKSHRRTNDEAHTEITDDEHNRFDGTTSGLSHLNECPCDEWNFGDVVGTVVWNHGTTRLYRDAFKAIGAAKRNRPLRYNLEGGDHGGHALSGTSLVRTSYACACVIYEIKGEISSGDLTGVDHTVYFRCCNGATHCLAYETQPNCPSAPVVTTTAPTTTPSSTTTGFGGPAGAGGFFFGGSGCSKSKTSKSKSGSKSKSKSKRHLRSSSEDCGGVSAMPGLGGICMKPGKEKGVEPEQTADTCEKADWCANYDVGGEEDEVFCKKGELCYKSKCNDRAALTHTHSCGLMSTDGLVVSDASYLVCADDLDCTDDASICPPGTGCFRECRPFA